jgi:organic hydroperoxide reductase OsmC/OhrA
MGPNHRYQVAIEWTGNTGTGTSHYREYARTSQISAVGKPVIAGSSDPAFRGERDRWNPEELLVAALAQCHLLSYLHVAVQAGVVVVAYADEPSGTMTEDGDGGGRFTEVLLRPVVTVADQSMIEAAQHAHTRANELCFIASSVNFPVRHEAASVVAT